MPHETFKQTCHEDRTAYLPRSKVSKYRKPTFGYQYSTQVHPYKCEIIDDSD